MKSFTCGASAVVIFSLIAGVPARTQTPQAPQDPNASADFLKRPAVVRQTPEAEQQMFLMQPGFRIENVLADPLIQDPVGVTWDGNGRMYVLEMRSYMQDADGKDSRQPVSRISRFESTKGDGVYDKHTVFADHLVLPRIAFPLGDGQLLVLETDNRDLYKYTDTDGDGVADKKELFYPGFGRVTNMEWQPGGLTWGLDNWLYSTYNPYRLRIAPNGKLLREETEPNGGQWWSAQDNYGKMWWVDGGGEIGPVNFQTPIVYGAFNVADNFEPDFQTPYGVPGGIGDMQGGMRRVKVPDNTLNHFTAASGVDVYRGDRMPGDMLGDLFFTEPVGRIVRRAKVVVTDGLTQLKNAYPKSEFVRSTDPLFRPVSISTGPDGALYLADMYTGIIQDAQFVPPASYLRRKVEQYELDRLHNYGRIWRITNESTAPDRTSPRMYSETPAQLVTHLEHPNGWWRDTAQMLLVLKQDKSVVPALKALARSSANPLARIHALWTLEGLNQLDAALAREFTRSSDPALRIQGIRASETLYKAGDRTFAADYKAAMKDADPDVVIQAMLTLNLHKVPDGVALIRTVSDASSSRGVKEIGSQIVNPRASQGQRPSLADTGAGTVNMSVDQRKSIQRGDAIYRELCTTCHAPDGKGVPLQGATDGAKLAPPLAGSARVQAHRDYVVKVLLGGLIGPVNGENYAGGVMASMNTNTDEWIADIASYVRNSFGNAGTFVTPAQVAAVRKVSTRKTPWTLPELEPTVPALLTNTASWKLSASVNTDSATNVITPNAGRWDTGVPQAPGQWFQIELPSVMTVAELQFDAQAPFNFGGGGRGAGAAGRGGAPAGAPGAGRGRGNFGPAAAPVGYTVQLSTDGTTWTSVAQGAGQPTTVAWFAPTPAKFVRITQTATALANEAWSIAALRVYALPQKR
jgi:mono/diheme cytochrome c family protein/glucose/arabinose dehydrogenase